MEYKLIYILNQYSKKTDQHYFHIISLLEEIASNGVKIALIIEKSDSTPNFKTKNIEVFLVKNHNKVKRLIETYKIINLLYNNGYNKVFVRISKSGIVLSIIHSFFSKLETYFWHSGTVFGFDKKHKKINKRIIDDLTFDFIKIFVKHFVTGPESMAKYYKEVCNVNENKIMILYNDIDLNRFKCINVKEKTNVKKELNIVNDENVILFVHRFSPVRETLFYLPYIFEEFYKYSNDNYIFILIGNGEDKNKLEIIMKNHYLKDKIRILGSIPNSDIQKYYSISDIFINPTMAEGFPRVIIEAEAMGLPIVSTDAGGIKDIVPFEQQDYIVSRFDKESFANALISLSKDASKQEILKKANEEYVNKFSTSNVAKMYIKKIFQ